MQNFRNFGTSGGGGDHFLTKPPKGTALPDFTRFEPLCVQIRSPVFSLGDYTKKKGHYKKSQRGYISRIWGEFPTEPNLTKIGV